MGWNEGYSILEETIVNVYNLGKLDKKMVQAIFKPYAGTDIDSGGSNFLHTKDGKTMEEAVIEAYGYKMPKKGTTEDEEIEYLDKVYKLFSKVTKELWGRS